MDFLTLGREVLASQPFSVLLGTELLDVGEGRLVMRVPLRPELNQQHGFAHGGVVSYLADNALTFAGALVLGRAVVTAEFKINFVRPGVGDALLARAAVVSAAKSHAVCRCDIFAVHDDVERLCATSLGTITRLGEPPESNPAM